MARTIKYIVVHCTAGSLAQSIDALKKFFLTPESKGGRGWSRYGYHYVIDGNGSVHHITDDSQISNGVANMNSVCLNVCYMGGIKQNANGKNCNPNVAADTRNNAQRTALKNLIDKLKKQYPDAVVVGHRYFADKACPSFDAGKEYGGLTGKYNWGRTVGPKGSKAKSSGISNPKVDAVSGGGFQAPEPQVEQLRLAYEAVGTSLAEIPDTFEGTITSISETVDSMVEMVNMPLIPITIPDPTEMLKEKIDNISNSFTDMVDEQRIILDNIITVPAGYEIPENQTLEKMLKATGGIVGSAVADILTPAGEFMANLNAKSTAAMSGKNPDAIEGTETESGEITAPDDDSPDQLLSEIDLADDVNIGNTLGTAGATIGDVTNTAMGAVNDNLAIFDSAAGAVGEIMNRVPGVIPNIITSALTAGVSTASDLISDVTGAVGDIVGDVTGAVGDIVGDVTGTVGDVTGAVGDIVGDVTGGEMLASLKSRARNISRISENPISDISNNEEPIENLNNQNLNNLTNTESTNTESTNTESTNNISSNTDVLDMSEFSAENISKQLEAAKEAANANMQAQMAANTPKTDVSKFAENETVKEEIIESTASSNANIAKLENEFKQTFTEEIHQDLYNETRKAILEIFPEIKPDDDSCKDSINTATFVALKLVPAQIQYIDEKFAVFEEKINILLSEFENKLNTLSAGTTGGAVE